MLIGVFANAQNHTLNLYTNGILTELNTSDSLSAQDLLQDKITEYRSEGYFAASVDSNSSINDTTIAYLTKGKQYSSIQIRKHNLSEGYLGETNTTLSLKAFDRLQKTILGTYEKSGYPFAKIVLIKPFVKGDTLSSELKFYPYVKFVYDTIVHIGNSKISKAYISKYLGTEEGKLYNEIDIKDIDKKLRNLPLVKLKGSSQIVFYQGKVQIILNVDDIVTDRVDGVVGLAPNSSNSDDNSLLITGEVNIELNNLFKSGKQLEMHWRNYLKNSQKLDLGFTYPYLFNTKLGINGEFNLNKYDSIFVNIKSKLSFRYQQKGNNYFQFYYQNINSNLITTDTNAVRIQKRIPSNNPYKIDNYGLALFQRDYDYLPNPRKGYSVLADFAVGQKTILRNTEISSVKFLNTDNNTLISLYDTMDVKSIRLDFSLRASLYIPIKKSSTIHQRVNFQALFANQIFFNELYNFGGFSTLRGFDENEIFASKALTYTLEYRYLIGENSNVGLFANAALIENKIESTSLIYDVPYGFGAVANIQVGSGILNLAYALGSQQGNPIQLNTAKFHFGVVNYF
jgi:hemolysin activation/secretion protein